MRLITVVFLAVTFSMPALAADSEKARIEIMRLEQGFGAKFPADILEVQDGGQQLLGRLWQGEKLVLEVAPGAKKYMTLGYGNHGEFLFTEPLMPGKTYHVMLR